MPPSNGNELTKHPVLNLIIGYYEMPYTSPTLEKLSKELECGHCGTVFHGTVSQAKHVKYEGSIVYCSTVCRSAAMSRRAQDQAIREGKKPRKGVMAGPCPVCNKMYESKNVDRKYCSQECYTKSDQFKKMLNENYKKGIKTQLPKWEEVTTVECPVCKENFRSRRSKYNKLGPQKFCSRLCYRKFKADLFDAWVANPQHIAMPQNYDEFMTQDELPCLVDGCDWKGRHLSMHLTHAHGIRAEDFKRAAGFNLSTGLVSPDLHQELCDREKVGVAVDRSKWNPNYGNQERSGYVSHERKEHQKKTRFLLKDKTGPDRTCKNCGKSFQQSTIFGRTLYCGVACRGEYYRNSEKAG